MHSVTAIAARWPLSTVAKHLTERRSDSHAGEQSSYCRLSLREDLRHPGVAKSFTDVQPVVSNAFNGPFDPSRDTSGLYTSWITGTGSRSWAFLLAARPATV